MTESVTYVCYLEYNDCAHCG